MIIPSIDIQNGQAVQLVGGRALALEAGDPRPLADRFGRVGPVAVIDLDAATGAGENRDLVESLLPRARCRVGGGVRSASRAIEWLDAGAESVILGTVLNGDRADEVLGAVPERRIIAALDAVEGEIVDHGWRRRTGLSLIDRVTALRGRVGGFLITTVEREGRMDGIDLDRARALRAAAGDTPLTIAGGTRHADEVGALDRIDVDVQVGMALYTGAFDLADAVWACLVDDPRGGRADGLVPTMVTDELGTALGLTWSDIDSLRDALETGRGVYRSRTRGRWVKGESSGAVQALSRVDLDCDRDTLRFTVQQADPGFCHRESRTCFGDDPGLGALARRLRARRTSAPPGSYTRRLLDDPALLRAKLIEEAAELADAVGGERVAEEAADLLYFAFTRLAAEDISLADVGDALRRRAGRVTRRRGDAKPDALQSTGAPS